MPLKKEIQSPSPKVFCFNKVTGFWRKELNICFISSMKIYTSWGSVYSISG